MPFITSHDKPTMLVLSTFGHQQMTIAHHNYAHVEKECIPCATDSWRQWRSEVENEETIIRE